MNFAAGLVALLLTAPIVAVAAVLWWPLALAVAAVAVGSVLAGRRVAR